MSNNYFYNDLMLSRKKWLKNPEWISTYLEIVVIYEPILGRYIDLIDRYSCLLVTVSCQSQIERGFDKATTTSHKRQRYFRRPQTSGKSEVCAQCSNPRPSDQKQREALTNEFIPVDCVYKMQ